MPVDTRQVRNTYLCAGWWHTGTSSRSELEQKKYLFNFLFVDPLSSQPLSTNHDRKD
jgi:hypothetical protein